MKGWGKVIGLSLPTQESSRSVQGPKKSGEWRYWKVVDEPPYGGLPLRVRKVRSCKVEILIQA